VVSSFSRHRSKIFDSDFCFFPFFFGCLGGRPFLFLLWGAWVLGSTAAAVAISVLRCWESCLIPNLAEPPFKRISGSYGWSRTEKGVFWRPRRHEIDLNGP